MHTFKGEYLNPGLKAICICYFLKVEIYVDRKLYQDHHHIHLHLPPSPPNKLVASNKLYGAISTVILAPEVFAQLFEKQPYVLTLVYSY